MVSVPTKSATCIIVSPKKKLSAPHEQECNYNVFMVRRSSRSRFMANAYVFPGGIFEPSDYNSSWRDICGVNDRSELRENHSKDKTSISSESFALSITAVREVFEESGIQILKPQDGSSLSSGQKSQVNQYRESVQKDASKFMDLCRDLYIQPDLDRLTSFTRLITPVTERWRYDTTFFLYVLDPGIAAADIGSHDARETTASAWQTPQEYLTLHRRRQLWLPPPTWMLLRRLSKWPDIRTLPQMAARHAAVSQELRDPVVPEIIPFDMLSTKEQDDVVRTSHLAQDPGISVQSVLTLPGDVLYGHGRRSGEDNHNGDDDNDNNDGNDNRERSEEHERIQRGVKRALHRMLRFDAYTYEFISTEDERRHALDSRL